MAKLFSYVAILFWSVLAMVFGLFLYTNGFLLRRNVMSEQSSCLVFSKKDSFDYGQAPSAALECLKPRARVILLIVDALKYEFVTKFHDAASATTFHRNKLPVFSETLQDYPKNTRLFKSIVDPPTVTMQRLKAMTTGSLPTFIDISSNFAADYITEDNFIDQNIENGNIFMGDDTWIGLYPDKFLRAYPAPSFDVSDLDTVDLEVKKQIFNEIEKTDWTLLVAHMLGIDHAGHKHGVHHPEMLRKLNETNTFIQDIIQKINKDKRDTVLFVIGDHGMTENGDHGGESLDETEAAMFIYSTVPLIDTSVNFNIEMKSVVNQISLVPTLSVILGIPVPFSNIGSLIIEALPIKEIALTSNSIEFVIHSLWRNIFQVHRYVNAYLSENSLPDEELKDLKSTYDKLLEEVVLVKSNSDLKEFVSLADEYFTTVRRIFYRVWVQFDPILMTRGLILFFCAIFSFFIVISGLIGKRMYSVLDSSFLICIFSATLISLSITLIIYWFEIIDDFGNTSLFFCGLAPILCFALLLIQNWDYVSDTWYTESCRKKSVVDILSRLVLLAIILGVFSNSYIIEENRILSYFLITTFIFLIYSLKSKNYAEHSDKKTKSTGKLHKKLLSAFVIPFLVLLICIVIRISNYFWRYREEQGQEHGQKSSSFVIGKAGSVTSKDMELIFVFTAIASLAFYITVVKIWLRDCGNLSGYSPCGLLARFCPGLIVVITSCYWILRLPVKSKLNPALLQRMNLLPSLVYLLVVIAILLIFYRPLAVFLLPKEKESISISQEETTVPKLYRKVKNLLYKKKIEDKNEIPVVFGLGTIYSACYVLLSVFLCLTYVLLLGYMIAPSVILMNLVCIGLLFISAMDRLHSSTNLEELLHVSNLPILSWFLIAEYFFYASGHQPSFSTIHWDAAFIGIDGSLQFNSLRAVLIGINTFGSHIILGMTLPLLIVAPFTIQLVFPKLTKSSKIQWEDIKRGELILFQNDVKFHSEVFSVAGRYILIHAFRVFACMFATFIHCRHLMVWGIFAPKLIFEGISFLITVGSILISLLLLLRVERCTEELISKIA